MKCVLYWSIGVIKRGETDAVACGNGLHRFDSFWSDEPSSLGEGFEPAFQSKSHAFQ